MWRKARKVWKRKDCNICKTGTKKLIAIQSNAKTFPLRCSLMKIREWFSKQALKHLLFKNILEI